jgi:hypothetical protein
VAPGLIEGLYLEGSAALGDSQPHTSDVDFVAVTADRLDAHARLAPGRVHSRLRGRIQRPHFDGVYLTGADLTAGKPGHRGTSP